MKSSANPTIAEDDVYITPSSIPPPVASSIKPINTTTPNIVTPNRPRIIEDDYDSGHYALARQSVYSGHYSLAEESKSPYLAQLSRENSSGPPKEGLFGIKRHHVAVCILFVVLIIAATIVGAIFGGKYVSDEEQKGSYFFPYFV